MLLLLDIGNTNTHLGLGDQENVKRQAAFPTSQWFQRSHVTKIKRFVGRSALQGVVFCSVVPRASDKTVLAARKIWGLNALELSPATIAGIGIDYPKPHTIGPDRLANAVAVRHHYGAPSVAVDFGTAMTMDVVNAEGNFVGGIIAPGLAALTEYLHEKTALLPQITIGDVKSAIGKNTADAMRIGAVHGYRGLVRELIREVKQELGSRRLPVVATGGYAGLIASHVPEITAVDPVLTLEGLRLVWEGNRSKAVV